MKAGRFGCCAGIILSLSLPCPWSRAGDRVYLLRLRHSRHVGAGQSTTGHQASASCFQVVLALGFEQAISFDWQQAPEWLCLSGLQSMRPIWTCASRARKNDSGARAP